MLIRANHPSLNINLYLFLFKLVSVFQKEHQVHFYIRTHRYWLAIEEKSPFRTDIPGRHFTTYRLSAFIHHRKQRRQFKIKSFGLPSFGSSHAKRFHFV